MSFKKKNLIISIILLIGFSFSIGYYAGNNNTIKADIVREADKRLNNDLKPVNTLDEVKEQISRLESQSSDTPLDFQLYWEVWDAVKKYYVHKGDISDRDLFYGSLKGIVAAVDDPYSSFFDPDKAKQFTDDISGKFEGVGIHIGIRDDRLTVIAPLKGSPADQAGLQAGDKIFFIDDFNTTGVTIDEAVQRIRGEKGSTVMLSILREGLDELKDIKVVRDTIQVPTVEWHEIEKDGGNYFYIKLSSFNETSNDELNTALNSILEKNPSGIIFDLRNNPGGLLDLAIKVSSLWVEDGVVVSEEFSDGRVNTNQAVGRAVLKDIPTVVLINQGSASASEIVAGALQDYDKAVLVGAQSFGKGSVQSLFEFGDHSAAKITIAEWLTPKNRQINERGIMPDIVVPYTIEDFNTDKDPQLEEAIKLLGMSSDDIQKEIEANKVEQESLNSAKK